MAELPAEKQRFLDEMKSFVEEEERWLHEMMDYIGWNIEDLPKITDANPSIYELCPINIEHRVPKESMEAHISKCWKKHGKYPDASKDVSSFIDDSASSSKTIDLSLLKPSNECSASTSQSSTSQCLIELLTAERDAKRRRATYRKKRIHTNKKSYNELLRELIDNEMRTLEFGLTTDDESKSSLNSAKEERVTKNSVYAGIGNWIYHGNPYKRWMTIEKEERELLENSDSARIGETGFHSNYSSDKSRHSREDRLRGREYSEDSSKRHERFRSDRYGEHHNFDDSSRHERSHSDRHHKRDHFDDRSRRHEQSHYSKSEHRHHEERRRSEFSSRHSSVCEEAPKRERSSRRSPSRDHKRHKNCEDSKRILNKSSKYYVKSESRSSSISRNSKLTEHLVSKQSSAEFNLENEAPVLNDTLKHEYEEKFLISNRRPSLLIDSERKHKKKKHKKKSKKNKKQRNSSESSS